MITMTEGRHKGQASVTIENETLRAEFICPGARMVSLFHKRLKHEFLFQGTSKEYSRGSYDSLMAIDQAAGADEMFPTIDPSFLPDFPWEGTRLPDHGELWTLDWDMQKLPESLVFSVHGVRLPYKLTRTASLTGESRLRLAYTLENLSPFEIPYLWSAHPMLQIEPGARIHLPDECKAATVGFSHSGRLGGFGTRITWPHWTDARGVKYDLSALRSGDVNDMETYYFTQPLKEGWSALELPSLGCRVHLSFPTDRVPFLGICTGEGVHDDWRFFEIMEPCSGPMARLDISRRYEPASRLPAKGKNQWYLDFEILT